MGEAGIGEAGAGETRVGEAGKGEARAGDAGTGEARTRAGTKEARYGRKSETTKGQTNPGQRNQPGTVPKAQAKEATGKARGRGRTIKLKSGG